VQVEAATVDKEVGVLVNNVGIFYSKLNAFEDLENPRATAKTFVEVSERTS